jgi:hypothetical protein
MPLSERTRTPSWPGEPEIQMDYFTRAIESLLA